MDGEIVTQYLRGTFRDGSCGSCLESTGRDVGRLWLRSKYWKIGMGWGEAGAYVGA